MYYTRYLLVLWMIFGLSACANIGKESLNNTQSQSIFVLMQTSMGDMKIELYADAAPISVANFLQYVDKGAYTDGSFYRVVRRDNDKGNPKITVVQGAANEQFTEFAPIELESTQQTGIKHLDGTLSMARLGPNTATHEFFVCIGAQSGLDFAAKRHPDGLGFAAFGRVVEGMDVARRINQIRAAKATDDPYLAGQLLAQPVIIQSVKRL